MRTVLETFPEQVKPELVLNFILFFLEIENYVTSVLVTMITVWLGLSLLNCRCLKVQCILYARLSGSFQTHRGQILPLISDAYFEMEGIALWRHLSTDYRGNWKTGLQQMLDFQMSGID